MKVAHLVSFPIHYQAPLYRELACRPELDLTVYFYSDASVRGYRTASSGGRCGGTRRAGRDRPVLPSAVRSPEVGPYGLGPNWDVLREVLWTATTHFGSMATRTRTRGSPRQAARSAGHAF